MQRSDHSSHRHMPPHQHPSQRSSSHSHNGHNHSHNHHQHHHHPYQQPQQQMPPREASPETMRQMSSIKVSQELLDYIQKTRFPYINDVSAYVKEEKIGQGTFGEVFKARCKRTGKTVALKKILMENEKEGFPITALREVKMLQQLKHENITELFEVCSSKTAANVKDRSTFYLVFAFCDHDLAGLLKNRNFRMKDQHIKTLLRHLLKGLDKLHRARVLHRDMKTANILVTKEGVLKLADFGLARPYFVGQPKLYTNRVVTLWYRPPELLLGARQYGPAIDIWGAGCIMAELWTKSPIMQGDTEQKQLDLISHLCGSMTPEVWPSVVDLPVFKSLNLSKDQPRVLTRKMSGLTRDKDALCLLDQLLSLDPSKRLTAEQALDHSYFFAKPSFQENIKDLMNEIEGSSFEYTVGSGAHAHRHRNQQPAQQPRQHHNQAIPPGHYSDMVF